VTCLEGIVRNVRVVCVLAATIVWLPYPLWAQGSQTGTIAGVVRDASGAVLPGVTVEAASPALIEKVRSVSTDNQGNYKIVDLRPGTYTVTFTLTGFGSTKREGLDLTPGFTVTANAELKVGSLEESVTVSGASPMVDVQNTRTQSILSQQVLDSIPTNKSMQSFVALTLGASNSNKLFHDVGGNKGENPTAFQIHGTRADDSKVKIEGMNFNAMDNSGGGTSRAFWINQAAIQEVQVETSGFTAEQENGGASINFLQKDGGSLFKAYFSGNFTNDKLQGQNLDDGLRAFA
jgi:hypothetical protein